MWQGFDPEIKRQLTTIKELTALRYQTPSHEWPFVFVEEHDALLVIREWPNGELTAYATSDIPGTSRGEDEAAST
jgi:hypothetical protein